jgi:hypothetical protein
VSGLDTTAPAPDGATGHASVVHRDGNVVSIAPREERSSRPLRTRPPRRLRALDELLLRLAADRAHLPR